MKKINFLCVIIILCSLVSCTTLETHIVNADTDYTFIPIIKSFKFLFGEKITVDNYSLVYKGNTKEDDNFLITSEVNIRNYDFTKDDVLLCRVEIVMVKKGLKSNNGSFVIYKREDYIQFKDTNGNSYKYALNYFNQSELNSNVSYFISDKSDEIIDVRYYTSKNKNNLDAQWTYHTGYRILVNEIEYGILSLNPVGFYCKNNMRINDNLALCILTAYASYIYQEF